MSLLDNLISYYPLDGDANDAHSTNHGTVYGAVSSPSSGILGGCYTFDGVSDYITITDNFATTWVTANMWVNSDDLDSTTREILFYDNTYNYYLRFYPAASVMQFLRRAGGTNRGLNVAYADIDAESGGWHMITIVDTASKTEFWVDGVLKASDSYGVRQTSGAGSLQISRNLDTVAYKGKLDEYGFWSVDIGSTLIAELYNSGSPPAYPFTTPAADNAILFGTNF